MKKSKHGVIRLIINLQIIKTVATRRKPVALEAGIAAGAGKNAQKRRCPVTKQNTVMKFVNRMLQIKAT